MVDWPAPHALPADRGQRKEANSFLDSGVNCCCTNEIQEVADTLTVESVRPVRSSSTMADYPYRGPWASTHCARLKIRVVVTPTTRTCNGLRASGMRSVRFAGPDFRPPGVYGALDHTTVHLSPDDQSYSAFVRP